MASTPDFKYAPMFQLGEDTTEYRLLSKEGVSTGEFEGKTILKVSQEALTLLAQQAFHDVEFMLRREHNLTLRLRRTTSTLLCSSCATPRQPARASCLSARTPVLPSSMARRDSAYGPTSRTKRLSRAVFTTHSHRTTCATRRTLRSICTTR